MTQEELAEAIGVSHRQYQRFEQGGAALKPKHLAALAKVLKCEVHELFGGRSVKSKFISHGSAAKQAQTVVAQNFAFVSRLLSAPLEYQLLIGFLLDDDLDQLEELERLHPEFVERLQRILSSR